MTGLTTHVLDTMRGAPAGDVAVELFALGADGARTLIASVRTNRDGRTDSPLVSAADARGGVFELTFGIGDYFRAQGVALPERPFLDVVPIRFAVADPKAHYHVPLLVTPWSYSTYRGS